MERSGLDMLGIMLGLNSCSLYCAKYLVILYNKNWSQLISYLLDKEKQVNCNNCIWLPHPHPSYDTSVRPRAARPPRWETTAPLPWAAASGTWHLPHRWKSRSRWGRGRTPGTTGFLKLDICIYIYIYCNGDPPWKATTCNIFWYNDLCRWFIDFPFVGISLDFSSGALWQNVLPQDFGANSFVRISSKISLLQLKFEEIWTMILTKFGRYFWRFFLWQNVVAKRFATRQNFVKIAFKFRQNHRSNFVKFELKQRNLWRKSDEILTKEFVAKSYGKMDCHKNCHEIFNEIFNETRTKSSTKPPRYTKSIANHELHLSNIYIYIYICNYIYMQYV